METGLGNCEKDNASEARASDAFCERRKRRAFSAFCSDVNGMFGSRRRCCVGEVLNSSVDPGESFCGAGRAFGACG